MPQSLRSPLDCDCGNDSPVIDIHWTSAQNKNWKVFDRLAYAFYMLDKSYYKPNTTEKVW